jgi:hypothetical protein
LRTGKSSADGATLFSVLSEMANPRLTKEQLESANSLLEEIRDRLEVLSNGNRELKFAFRRKIFKELMYDERSKPMARRALKIQKMKEQSGLCPICNEQLGTAYMVLDRFTAVDGYTAANTRLIHPECDRRVQEGRKYT